MRAANCWRSRRGCLPRRRKRVTSWSIARAQARQLSIGAVGPYHVTEMLAAFNRAYPGIELAVKIGNSTDVLRDLLDYKSDIAVLAHIDEDDRLLTVPYRRHPVAVFVRKDHRLARQQDIKIADLEESR